MTPQTSLRPVYMNTWDKMLLIGCLKTEMFLYLSVCLFVE